MNKLKVELIVFLYMLLGYSLVSCQPNYRFIHPEGEGKAQNCDPLPSSFNEENLAGTWQAEYFGGLASDLLIIREDGKFKQILTSEPRNLESEWQNWWLEFDDDPLKDNRFEPDIDAGDIIVFPSYLWHTSTPVIKGTKTSLAMWCLGPPFV